MEDNQILAGTVVWFNNKKNFGFIQWEKDGVQQRDIFVHYSDINISGFKTLTKGQRVSFKIGVNHSGDPKAIEVTPLEASQVPQAP
jgi:CspA family cold shock protein